MKPLDYKTTKWEKRKEMLIKDSHYTFDEIQTIEKKFLERDFDDIHYHYLLGLLQIQISETEFVQGNFDNWKNKLLDSMQHFHTAFQLFHRGKKTSKSVQLNIEQTLQSGYLGYYAILLEQYALIDNITDSNCGIAQMLRGNMIPADHKNPIAQMQNAIVAKNSKEFETALKERIKQIRRFSVDYYLCCDIFSIGLIAEAQRQGLEFNSHYIETDFK